MKKEINKLTFERGLAIFVGASLALAIVVLLLVAGSIIIYDSFNTS